VAPVWSRQQDELFYRAGDSLIAVRISASSASFNAGRPAALFTTRFLNAAGVATYDVSADGRRFVVLKEAAPGTELPQAAHVVLNWFEELKRLVPVN
jgi:hypothetical protein